MTLSELISADPDGRGYSGMSDAAVAADLNERRHTVRRPIAWEVFFSRMYELGVFNRVQTAAEGPWTDVDGVAHAERDPVAYVASRDARDARRMGISTVTMDAPVNVQLFGALVQNRVMSEAELAALDALANSPVSLAEIHSLGQVHHLDVAAARSAP